MTLINTLSIYTEGQNYIKIKNYYLQFIKENQTTDLFLSWATDYLKYSAWTDLLRYNWLFPHYNKISRKDFKIPDSYFDFISEYQSNDVHFFSLAHASFLHELFMYDGFYKNGDLNSQFQKYIEDNTNIDSKQALAFLDAGIDKRFEGFTKELFISRYFYQFLEWKDIEKFEVSYDSSYTKEHFFKAVIKDMYAETKKYLENQNVEKYNISIIKSDVTKNLLDTIFNKYKGKVIYIDFWAPWCGPCLAEMENIKQIQEKYDTDNVTFLFLASRCKENSWQATIANKDIKGHHILLTDDQFNIFSKYLNIEGIPHYTLVDQSGNIVAKNATHPIEQTKLVNEIDWLLKSNKQR